MLRPLLTFFFSFPSSRLGTEVRKHRLPRASGSWPMDVAKRRFATRTRRKLPGSRLQSSGGTSSFPILNRMDRATPGILEMRPARSSVSTI